jgi:spartin
MTSASNYYIAHSEPSPHVSGAASPTPGAAAAGPSTPPPPPSRTLLLLQSPTTRSHLARIYAVSGGAVKLSHKAAAAAERLIQHAVGADNKGKGRASAPATPPPSSPSPSPGKPPPPGKPPLPPRSRGPSPAPPLASPRHGTSPASSRGPSPTPPPLPTRTRAALSATLILASLSASTVRLIDAGGAAVAAAVSHRYGAVAGDNAGLAVRTMHNVALVYVDLRGFGRRALVKRTAKTWAGGRAAAGRG